MNADADVDASHARPNGQVPAKPRCRPPPPTSFGDADPQRLPSPPAAVPSGVELPGSTSRCMMAHSMRRRALPRSIRASASVQLLRQPLLRRALSSDSVEVDRTCRVISERRGLLMVDLPFQDLLPGRMLRMQTEQGTPISAAVLFQQSGYHFAGLTEPSGAPPPPPPPRCLHRAPAPCALCNSLPLTGHAAHPAAAVSAIAVGSECTVLDDEMEIDLPEPSLLRGRTVDAAGNLVDALPPVPKTRAAAVFGSLPSGWDRGLRRPQYGL